MPLRNVTKITLEVKGKGTITIDPTTKPGVAAIIIADEGADLLARYYDAIQNGVTKGSDVLTKWNTADPTTKLPPDYLTKMQDCTFN